MAPTEVITIAQAIWIEERTRSFFWEHMGGVFRHLGETNTASLMLGGAPCRPDDRKEIAAA